MAALQLNFTLDTPGKVKTVHLLGSWDGYRGQLPLSKTFSGGKSASWAGKFRFQSSMLKPGQRYWYYYILDGYHVYHDPDCESTVERTTKRTLNILDVPANMGQKSSSRTSAPSSEVARGRALSPSRIQHPKPSKPYESRRFCESSHVTQRAMDALNARFQAADLSDSDSDISSSPSSAFSSSLRGGSTSPSSISSFSDSSSSCSCQLYAITSSKERVRIHCGGKRCGGSSPCDSSGSDFDSCSSDSDEEYEYARPQLLRQNIRIRR
ncbi:hypothetical protein D8B26_004151 [Coccidioides posadasii str. Silveira]|uniref:ESDC n=1 Tax=Coccidioides posadasii (strain RMSCC 757 / Silveira) TaxID=443226 RepID=E9DK01_COCPS|nr:ESDC [Coccidioides posadasii str. Silveira]QVM09491.1 hypothetical protein D8B26_004151 [Coccidioides posadasii str. Silveira]